MRRKNVLPATILVAATIVTTLVFATVPVPNSIGIASANPCSTNGRDGGDGSWRDRYIWTSRAGGTGGNAGESGDIGECTLNIEDSELTEP